MRLDGSTLPACFVIGCTGRANERGLKLEQISESDKSCFDDNQTNTLLCSMRGMVRNSNNGPSRIG